MHYIWWHVPVITSPMLIAMIAIVHVLVSHYAVGGGILIALENQFALKNGDKEYRNYWKKHTQFFVLLTLVFGAITGVGIWWTIGLTSPLATGKLIHIFVFGWGIEWVCFIVEIIAAFILYYYWDKLPDRTIIAIGWIYAVSAWLSLFFITGITGFMLNTDGLIGDWKVTQDFWHAFFNVQLIPQTFVRTGGALLLSSLYVYVHAAWTLKDNSELLHRVVKRMSIPLFVGNCLLIVGIVLWLLNLPQASLMLLESASVLNIFVGILAGLAGILFLLILFGPILNPKSLTFPFAVSLFIFGLTAFSLSEFVREAIRKPYIVDRIVLGNQIYAHQVESAREKGFLNSGVWTKMHREKFPEKIVLQQDKIALGQTVFMYHCSNCHAAEHGYSAAAPRMAGESAKRIAEFVKRLNEPVYAMPPWSGNDEEADWLAAYLESIRPEHPRK